jgi:hypothetical protein
VRLDRSTLALTLLLSAASCLTPTEVKVVVTTRALACKGQGDLAFDSLAIVASPTEAKLLSDSPAISSRCVDASGARDLGSLVLVPTTSDRAEVVVAAGISVAGGSSKTAEECLTAFRAFRSGNSPSTECSDGSCLPCVVATRAVGFVPHEKLTLEIELTAECKGVFCAAGQTCGANGACVSNDTSCHGATCNLTTGQGGSSASSTSSSSSSSASSTTSSSSSSSSSSSGTGGGGPTFTPVQNGNASIGQVNDMWGAQTDDVVWVAGSQGLFKCDAACAPVSNPLTPPLLRISGDAQTGRLGVISQNQFAAGQTNGSFQNAGNFTCTPSDVFVSGTQVFAATNAPPLAYFTTLSGTMACAGDTWPATLAAPVRDIWYFPGTSVAWAVGGSTIVSNQAGKYPALSSLSGLWGLTPGGSSLVVSCVSAAPQLFVAGPGSTTLVAPTSCEDLYGFPRSDGGDVWLAGPKGVAAVHLTAALQAASSDSTYLTAFATDPPYAVFPSLSYVYVGTAQGLFRAPRPILP